VLLLLFVCTQVLSCDYPASKGAIGVNTRLGTLFAHLFTCLRKHQRLSLLKPCILHPKPGCMHCTVASPGLARCLGLATRSGLRGATIPSWALDDKNRQACRGVACAGLPWSLCVPAVRVFKSPGFCYSLVILTHVWCAALCCVALPAGCPGLACCFYLLNRLTVCLQEVCACALQGNQDWRAVYILGTH
jgi:hypothetical protein